MRLTTFWLLVVIGVLSYASAACVGEVGGSRTPPGSGSGSETEAPSSEACTKLEKDVVIRAAADMTALPRSGCYDIYGKLTVQGASITSLAALNAINSVDELELDHTGLTTIDTARPLGIYGRLTVTGNARLVDLRQLSFETAPSGILIDGNPALISLDALDLDAPRLTQVDGDVAITGNPVLLEVPLSFVTKIGGALNITGNLALKTIDLGALVTVGHIELADNPKLTSVAAFATTTTGLPPEVGGDLVIRNHAALTTLGTMGALRRVVGNLTIDNNPVLTNLAAFTPSIQYIDGALAITNNPALTDLGALKHLQLVGAVAITNNKNLVICRAAEIDQCVLHPVASVITNNKSGSCTVSCL